MKTFQDQGLLDIKNRIDAEPFCGTKILRVDGQRVGHVLQDEQVEEMTHFLATALSDLELIFTHEHPVNNPV